MWGPPILARNGSAIRVVSVSSGHGDQRLIRIPSMRPLSLRLMRGFKAHLRRNLWLALWLAALNLALAFVLFLMLR